MAQELYNRLRVAGESACIVCGRDEFRAIADPGHDSFCRIEEEGWGIDVMDRTPEFRACAIKYDPDATELSAKCLIKLADLMRTRKKSVIVFASKPPRLLPYYVPDLLSPSKSEWRKMEPRDCLAVYDEAIADITEKKIAPLEAARWQYVKKPKVPSRLT